jgi:hypothetical protein
LIERSDEERCGVRKDVLLTKIKRGQIWGVVEDKERTKTWTDKEVERTRMWRGQRWGEDKSVERTKMGRGQRWRVGHRIMILKLSLDCKVEWRKGIFQ